MGETATSRIDRERVQVAYGLGVSVAAAATSAALVSEGLVHYGVALSGFSIPVGLAIAADPYLEAPDEPEPEEVA